MSYFETDVILADVDGCATRLSSQLGLHDISRAECRIGLSSLPLIPSKARNKVSPSPSPECLMQACREAEGGLTSRLHLEHHQRTTEDPPWQHPAFPVQHSTEKDNITPPIPTNQPQSHAAECRTRVTPRQSRSACRAEPPTPTWATNNPPGAESGFDPISTRIARIGRNHGYEGVVVGSAMTSSWGWGVTWAGPRARAGILHVSLLLGGGRRWCA